MQPDLADFSFGELGSGARVDDDQPLAGDHLTAGHVRYRGGRLGGDGHGTVLGELFTVQVDHAGTVLDADGGHRQGGFGHAVGGFDGRRGKSVGGECVGEFLDGGDGDRFGSVEQARDIGQIPGLAGRWQSALGGQFEREVGCGGEHPPVCGFGGQLFDPAARASHERQRRHQGDVSAAQRRKQDHDQAHVVIQRQPAHTADVHVQAAGQDHLQHIGAGSAVRDLYARRGPRRARGVLQIRQIVGVEGGGNERGAHRVGNRVDRDHPWAARTRELAQERVHRFGGAVGGENDRRGGIGEHRVEALGVTGQLGGEQRHRDVPGLDGREKPDHIIQALRRQNRHPVPRRRDLLQAGPYRPHPGIELVPAQLDRHAVVITGEVEVPVGRGGTELGDIALKVGQQRRPGRQID
ncbi:Uncharacterised protein [Mycobacteroides abscessus subsp. massiliense]|nr:Uncharacterised protein [Mycobacteroides abscessus subsp. massiliense]